MDSSIATSNQTDDVVETRTQRRWRGVHDDLLDAVFELIVESREAFAVTDIAERADVAQGTFYNHFPDKQAAIVATRERDRAQMTAKLAKYLDDDPSALRQWVLLSGALVHRFLNDPPWCHFATVAYHSPDWPREGSESPNFGVIKAGIAEGTMDVRDVQLASNLMHHLHLGLAMYTASDRQPDLNEILDTLMRSEAPLLGVDSSVIGELIEWVIPRLNAVVWT